MPRSIPAAFVENSEIVEFGISLGRFSKAMRFLSSRWDCPNRPIALSIKGSLMRNFIQHVVGQLKDCLAVRTRSRRRSRRLARSDSPFALEALEPRIVLAATATPTAVIRDAQLFAGSLASGNGTHQIAFGVPANAGGGQSVIRFNPAGSVPLGSSPTSVILGTLTFQNRETQSNSTISSAVLRFTVVAGNQSHTMDARLSIDTTNNIGNVQHDVDAVVIRASSTITVVTSSGESWLIGVTGYGRPPAGSTTSRLVVAENASGSIQVVASVSAIPRPDLVATTMTFRVPADTSGLAPVFAPPFLIPSNVAVEVTATIRNQGTATAGRFTVSLYASADARIDSATDVFVTVLGTVSRLAASTSQTLTIKTLIPARLAGAFFLGIVVDSARQVTESNETNNSSQGLGRDLVRCQITDPKPSFTYYPGYASEFDASLDLYLSGFSRVVPLIGDIGWAHALSPNLTVVSPLDGVARSGNAYRQHAHVFGPGGRYRYFNFSTQELDSITFSSWTVVVEGTTTFGEPNPYSAFLWGINWVNTVREWHGRF